MTSDDLGQIGRLYDTRLAPEDCSVAKEDQRGNAAHLVGMGRLLIFVDIDLNDGHGISQLVFDLFKNGRHHLAWAAPGREEINQNGFV